MGPIRNHKTLEMVLKKNICLLLKFYQIYNQSEKKYYHKSHLWEKNNQIFFWFLFSCKYFCVFTKKVYTVAKALQSKYLP